MNLTITIPDELVPGIVATATLSGQSPLDVVQATAIAQATKVCQDLKVGPFYVGPILPLFNADGTPYEPPE